MTSKLDHYRKLRDEYLEAEEWAGMLGRPYSGGEGGHGHLGHLVISKAVIYFNNGSRNYHDIPEPLKNALEHVVAAQLTGLLGLTIALMNQRVQEAAKAAADEHAELMRAVGLPTPESK